MLPDFQGYPLTDLSNPLIARMYLGELLQAGQITLLLGAGVSVSSGMPSWTDLVSGCEADVGIDKPSVPRSSQELMQAMDEVRERVPDTDKFQELVWKNLYPEAMRSKKTYSSDVVADRMLIALGALVMNSTRGSVSEVFTMNFDDLLEWYLQIHGFRSQVITDFPSELRGDRDVLVFHPHGFVPLTAAHYPSTRWLVLSYAELLGRLAGTDGSSWPLLLESRLMSSHLLAVGTSLSDIDLDVVLTRVHAVIADRPTGFVVTNEIDGTRRRALLSRGMVPIAVGSHEAIPEFLLEVCAQAAVQL